MTDHVDATRQGAGLRLHENTPEDRRRAALYIATRAQGREDLPEKLLAAVHADWTRRERRFNEDPERNWVDWADYEIERAVSG